MSRRTFSFAPVLSLILACTAPPRPVEAPPPAAPPVRVRVGLSAPELDAAGLDAEVARPLLAALTRLTAVRDLQARSDGGRVDLLVSLATPAAIAGVRDAVEAAQPRLPPALEPPVFTRLDGVEPVLTVAVPPMFAGAVRAALERTAGVARVDLCGALEPRVTVVLDRARLDRAPVDLVLAAVERAVKHPGDPVEALARGSLAPDPLEALARGSLHGSGPGDAHALAAFADLRLRDVAVIETRPRPQPCRAYNHRGPVALLTVHAVRDADRARVAADARAHAVDLVSPTVDFFADHAPGEGLPDLAVLALDSPRDGAELAACLAAAPHLPAWALTVADAGARLLVGAAPAAPIDPVLQDISRCAGTSRVAVLAPAAAADHGLALRVFGPDPLVLAAVADRIADRLAALPDLRGLHVRAARPRDREAHLQRDVLAARGVPLALAARAVQLAVGPVTVHGPRPDAAVDIDLADRSGPLEQRLGELRLAAPAGPVALADLVRMQDGPPAPRYRVGDEPAALVDLRLRRAADRELVLRAVQDVELPAGVRVEVGDELPAFDP